MSDFWSDPSILHLCEQRTEPSLVTYVIDKYHNLMSWLSNTDIHGSLIANIYILNAFTEKPYSKQMRRM